MAMVIEDAIIHYFEDKQFIDEAEESARVLEARVAELEKEVFKKHPDATYLNSNGEVKR